MWKFSTVILMSFVLTGFSNPRKQRMPDVMLPRKAVNEVCLEHIHTSDCKFYECWYERFPCTERLAKKLQNIYCDRVFLEDNDLYYEETYWLKTIIYCFMFGLAPSYVSEFLDCNSLTTTVLRIQRECYMQSNICEAGWQNREGLWYLYSQAMTSLPHHYEWLWYNIALIASNCSQPSAAELAKWIKSHTIHVHDD